MSDPSKPLRRVTTLHRPTTLLELTRVFAELPDALILAGGASVMKRLHKAERPEHVIDLSQLSELRGIQVGRYGSWVGALTTLKQLAEDPLVRKQHSTLGQASGYGPPQIRGRASIGGAVIGRHFDTLPVLLSVDCYVELRHHVSGKRRLKLREFLRSGSLPGEILVALHLPPPSPGEHTFFRRVQSGCGELVIAARVVLEDQHVRQAAVVVGGLDLPAAHLHAVEEALVARTLSPQAAALVPGDLEHARPYQRAVSMRTLRSWLEHLSTPQDDIR